MIDRQLEYRVKACIAAMQAENIPVEHRASYALGYLVSSLVGPETREALRKVMNPNYVDDSQKTSAN